MTVATTQLLIVDPIKIFPLLPPSCILSSVSCCVVLHGISFSAMQINIAANLGAVTSIEWMRCWLELSIWYMFSLFHMD